MDNLQSFHCKKVHGIVITDELLKELSDTGRTQVMTFRDRLGKQFLGHARDILRTSSGILAISLRIVFAEKPSISATSETLYISLTTFYTRDNIGTF